MEFYTHRSGHQVWLTRLKKIGLPVAVTVIINVLASCHSTTPVAPGDLHPLNSAFQTVATIPMAGLRPLDTIGVAVCSDSIYVLSHDRVREFGSDGKLARTIGSAGWMPGEFIRPRKIACDEQGHVYVLDQKEGRIAIFDRDGKVVQSFSIGIFGFAGLDMSLGPSGLVYVSGLRRPALPGSPMVYKFTPDGGLLAQFDPEDPNVSSLNLAVVGWVSMGVGSSGAIFTAQAISPVVQVYSPDGRLVRSFRVAPRFYRSPSRFPTDPPIQKIGELLARWTELLDLRVLPAGGPVVARFWLHSPKAYDLELYSQTGELLTTGVATDMVLASVDARGHLYFYDPQTPNLKLVEMQVALPEAHAHEQ